MTSVEEIEQLRGYGAMLSQVAAEVEEFCGEDTTTIEGVRRLKAELILRRALSGVRNAWGGEADDVIAEIVTSEKR